MRRLERIVQGRLRGGERGFDPRPAGGHGNVKVGINHPGIYGKESALFKTPLAHAGEVVFE